MFRRCRPPAARNCVIGQLSSYIVMGLAPAGYTNVNGLIGAYNAWTAEKHPVTK